MKKGFNIFIIIISLFCFISLLILPVTYLGLIATQRLDSSEDNIIKLSNILFNKINLGIEIDSDQFSSLEDYSKSHIVGFKGFIFKHKTNILYESNGIDNYDYDNWKIYPKSSTAIAKINIFKSSWKVQSPSSNHEMVVLIDIIDKDMIKSCLLYILVILSFYLLFLVIILIILLFKTQNSIKHKNSLNDFSSSTQESDFILSLNTLQQFDSFLKTAFSSYNAFSVAVLKIKNDIFNEEKYQDGFTLLRTHINYNDGYFENNNHQMILLLPDIGLKEGIKLLEEFSARFMEDNIDVDLNCGITSMNGRNVTSSIMINESEKALYKAISDSDNTIVGFNPDPDLYKESKKN